VVKQHAQTVINTIKVLQLVLSGYPAAIPAVAAATVAGFAVKNIVNTKVTRAGGAIPTLGNGVINNGANVVPLSNGDNTLTYVRKVKLFLTNNNKH
jgi:hypothetical protein